ncbi:trehalase family glycosidase [Ferruginibacter paludis]|uniref:MGH1-like glycoside hydrolase domain-containing protein n=1 Tax=Ferruginibacter paludis TaxID=1310417 RepID=UPI0025B2C388|nr:trehalase family glycosidase [Ferruginibacter paludis]MDN3658172.1 trehalase family glycosidase [Ferruginibacter paludis]
MVSKIIFSTVMVALLITATSGYTQTSSRNIRTPEYQQLQAKLCKGWNTWYNNSMLTHTLLPQGFSINVSFGTKDNKAFLKDALKASDILKRPEKVLPGLRSDDGSYTSLQLQYMQMDITVETATDGEDEIILISPARPSENYLVIEAGLLWNGEGETGMKGNQLTGKFPGKTITVSATTDPVSNAYSFTTAPHLSFLLHGETGIYTGKTRTLSNIKGIIASHREAQQKKVNGYGELAESFQAMQNILAWNTIYDAPQHRTITPVSRLWNQQWGGFVLFEWDTYFASYMFSLYNKDLAYANAIEMTKAITPEGLVPNFQSVSGYQAASGDSSLLRTSSWDRSEPPVGSMIVLNIYKKYKETWFLNEVYDELLTWNRWWNNNRAVKGYLAWGSYYKNDTAHAQTESYWQSAAYESGLDNSPMYDGVPFNTTKHLLELADVGLMSLYIADCNALMEIATVLGKNVEAAELKKRSAFYTKQLATLWDEKAGIFLNKRLDNGDKSERLSPTNFYPMLAKACTPKQAERMIKEHYYNPEEFYGEYVMPSIARNDSAFKDNSYWRGRIWAPMNFLVYLGMQQYDVKNARADLINKSKNLLLKNWKENGGVFENYNAVTGKGDDVYNADGFYHWGALLGFMEFIERGYMKQ